MHRGEYPFFVVNINIPYEQVDVNVHPMKTEVRFNDEWRVYHVLKSGVSEALSEILNTIPNLQKINSESNAFFQNIPKQSAFNFDTGIQTNSSSFNKQKIDRAVSYTHLTLPTIYSV